ncbi:MAG: methyltransferase domain-containing protein [Flavisolibacter sp.]
MPSFKNRSYKKELLDQNDIPFEDIKRNMQELDLINRRLGGHDITIAGFSGLQKHNLKTKEDIHVVEIGCGGGDNLRAIKKWANKKMISVRLTGIDINAECISFAQSQSGNKGIEFIHSDYRDTNFNKTPQIIFSSLFCHHFNDIELVRMLKWMHENTESGFFINDLHRHPLAFYSIKLLTAIFSKSYLVKNDAPLSVQRGFKRNDWIKAFKNAGIENYTCEWKWAFRWLITCSHS